MPKANVYNMAGKQVGDIDLVVDLTDLFADFAVFLDFGGINVALIVGHGGEGRALFVDDGKVGTALIVSHIGLRVNLGLFAVEQEKPNRYAADHNHGEQTEQNAPDNLFHTRMPPKSGIFPIILCLILQQNYA